MAFLSSFNPENDSKVNILNKSLFFFPSDNFIFNYPKYIYMFHLLGGLMTKNRCLKLLSNVFSQREPGLILPIIHLAPFLSMRSRLWVQASMAPDIEVPVVENE